MNQIAQRPMITEMIPRKMKLGREPSDSSLRIDREKWIDMAQVAWLEAGTSTTAGPRHKRLGSPDDGVAGLDLRLDVHVYSLAPLLLRNL